MLVRNIVHLCLTMISMALAVLIFLISHEKLWIDELKLHINHTEILSFLIINKIDGSFLKLIFPYVTYVIILLLLVFLTHLSIKYLIFKLDKISFEKEQIDVFEQANDFYLPVYLGYSFVAISLPTIKSFILFFILMLFILYNTRFFYFNPLFLVLGYKFYFVNNKDKSRILIITKKEVKVASDFFVNSDGHKTQEVALIKINNHTYLLKNS